MKRGAIRGFFVVALILFFGVTAFPQSSRNETAPIASALQDKEFEKALELLHPVLQASPANAQLWAMQGAAYAGKGDTPQALVSFQRALKLSPDYLPALQGAIQIDYEAGNASAIPLLRRVLQQRPGDRISHGMLAVLEYQQGDCKAATPHFEKAGSLFDDRPTALHAYAICLVKLKQFDHAVQVFQQSVALQPEDAQERRLLASIQVMAHRPTEAVTTLEPLLAKDPDAATLELAATAYEGSNETDRAVASLKQAILLDPRNVNLYLDFANLSFSHESFQVGIDVINDGMALSPAAAPLYFARGVLYVQLAQYEKAEADFEKAYELDPSQSLSVAAQGMAAAQENDLDSALAKTRASLARQPNDPILLYLQADILAEKHPDPGTAEFESAMVSARKAVSLRPNLGAAHEVLAKLYLQSGKNREAADECRKALASNPKDQAAVYHLIQALRKTGNNGEIPALLKRLADLRKQAVREDSERYRYKLVEGDEQAK